MPDQETLGHAVASAKLMLEQQRDHLQARYEAQVEEIEFATTQLKELKAQNSAREDAIEDLETAIKALAALET